MFDTTSLSKSLESSIPISNIQDEDGQDEEATATRHMPTIDDLLARCSLLIEELEQFKHHLKANKQDQIVEIAHFRNTVKSEHRTLERLASQDSVKTQHTVNSSNVPFLETVWAVVKSTTGLQALQKRFYWKRHEGCVASSTVDQRAIRGLDKKKQSALVDVVGKDGLEWIKVSLITNNRLLFDKAKQGWEGVSSSSEESDLDSDQDDLTLGINGNQILSGSNGKQDDAEYDIPLIRMAKDLLRAATAIRIRTRHPTIRLVLPKIHEHQIPEIDAIISTLRTLGCIVETASTTLPAIASPRPLSTVIHTLLTNPFDSLTPTLNIDCTILLALVSDFSHCTVESEPWFHRALKRQVEIEDRENLLPNLLYPAIAGHDLVCTTEAAKRMREIVDTIGTAGENARTLLFLGPEDSHQAAMGEQGELDSEKREKREKVARDELQTWSKFKVPDDLHIPIRIVDSGIPLTNLDLTTEQVGAASCSSSATSSSSEAATDSRYHTPNNGSIHTENDEDVDEHEDRANDNEATTPPPLPLAAQKIQPHLTSINQSVFLHGWAHRISTITSNRTVVKQIDSLLEKIAQDEEDWPLLWLCPTARSLVGKEKRGGKGGE